MFAVQTDGQENASREYTREQIFEMIRARERAGDCDVSGEPSWEFVFLAANQDATQEGGHMGFVASKAVDFDADAGGVHAMYSIVSEKVAMRRRDRSASLDFSEAERARASKKR